MRRIILILSAALTLASTGTAAARTHHRLAACRVPNLKGDSIGQARHKLTRAHCELGTITRPNIATGALKVSSQMPRAGQHRKRGAKIRIWLKAPNATTAPVTTTTPAPTPVRSNIDPSFTQDSTNPLVVTFTYGASDVGGGPLPDGTVTLGIFEHNQTAASYQCTSNIGGTQQTATCTVTLAGYGLWDLSVTYSGGGNVSSTGATETVDIGAPAPPPPPPPPPIATTTTLSVAALITDGITLNMAGGDPGPWSYSTTLTDITTAQTATTPTVDERGPVTPVSLSVSEVDNAGQVTIGGLGTVTDADTICMTATTLATTIQGQPYAASTSAAVQIWPWNGLNACP